MLAYEPVWAIGTGQNATPAQAQEAHAHLRSRLRQWLGADAAERCCIHYGGSVKPDNVAVLMSQPDVDGALVGGRQPGCPDFAEIRASIACSFRRSLDKAREARDAQSTGTEESEDSHGACAAAS